MESKLTEIARQLKSTFEGEFGGAELQEEVQAYSARYGDAESIRIGEMTYIVINEEYKREEFSDVPENTSPLFYNSIKVPYAIIDAKTSSTLIDEVYSRITYIKKVYDLEVSPSQEEIRKSLGGLIGNEEHISRVEIPVSENEENTENKANIYQCQLIKDTGVSAAPDVYSFMMKDGEIKEIAASVMKQIRRAGTISLMKDRESIESSQSAIQQAVFNKYVNSDIEIQSVTVKSIFEICLSFNKIHLLVEDETGATGIYNTSYLASENNEFEALNANIHVCNLCGHDLIDVRDASKVYKLHINTDAYDPVRTTSDKVVYATGCEDCLEQCPDCGKWHFNYAKFVGSRKYDKVHFAPGRSFIKSLRTIDPDINYCFCREGVEWVYDEKSGTENEHEIMPLSKIAFINYSNEKLASYEDYYKFYEKEKRKSKASGAISESRFAKETIGNFKKRLAQMYETDEKDIKISSLERCKQCGVCGGEYYIDALGGDYGYNFRCNVCDEMISEKKHIVTRNDGIVFMLKAFGKGETVSKYIVTKLGNLKKLSSNVGNFTGKEEQKLD